MYKIGFTEEYRGLDKKGMAVKHAAMLSFGMEHYYHLSIESEEENFYKKYHLLELDNKKIKEFFGCDYKRSCMPIRGGNEQFVIPIFPHWKKDADPIKIIIKRVTTLYHPEILQQIIAVAEKPCDYLPSRKELDQELVKASSTSMPLIPDSEGYLPSTEVINKKDQELRKAGNAKAPTDHEALVYSLKHDREVLQCDILPKPNREKVRVDFLDFQKDENGQLARTDRKISLEVQRLD